MKRTILSAVFLASFLVGCSSEQADGEFDSYFADGKADETGLTEGTYRAHAVIGFASTADYGTLRSLGISHHAAQATVDAGRPFPSLAAIDAVPFTGQVYFETLREHVELEGLVGSCGDGVVQEGLESCDDVSCAPCAVPAALDGSRVVASIQIDGTVAVLQPLPSGGFFVVGRIGYHMTVGDTRVNADGSNFPFAHLGADGEVLFTGHTQGLETNWQAVGFSAYVHGDIVATHVTFADGWQHFKTQEYRVNLQTREVYPARLRERIAIGELDDTYIAALPYADSVSLHDVDSDERATTFRCGGRHLQPSVRPQHALSHATHVFPIATAGGRVWCNDEYDGLVSYAVSDLSAEPPNAEFVHGTHAELIRATQSGVATITGEVARFFDPAGNLQSEFSISTPTYQFNNKSLPAGALIAFADDLPAAFTIGTAEISELGPDAAGLGDLTYRYLSEWTTAGERRIASWLDSAPNYAQLRPAKIAVSGGSIAVLGQPRFALENATSTLGLTIFAR